MAEKKLYHLVPGADQVPEAREKVGREQDDADQRSQRQQRFESREILVLLQRPHELCNPRHGMAPLR